MANGNGPNPTQERPFVERRKRNDWVTNMSTILSLVAWSVAFVVWLVLDMAAPESEHMFSRMFSVEVRNYWDSSLLPMAFTLLIISLCISIAAFVFNMLRKKRKTDKYKKSIIVAGCITIVGIVMFIVRFGDMLMWG